jgi:serine/threonine protein kinase
VTEFCSRGTLYNVLNDPAISITWERFFEFSLAIASGVNYLHNFDPKIFHRDIKSLNFLVFLDLFSILNDHQG